MLDSHFGESTYSLRSIFHDDQRDILNMIMQSSFAGAEAVYSQFYETHLPIMRFMNTLHIPSPRAFQTAAVFALNSTLRKALDDDAHFDYHRVQSLLDEARSMSVELDGATLGYTLRKALKRMSEELAENPENTELIRRLEAASKLARELPFPVIILRAQNRCYQLLQDVYPDFLSKAGKGDPAAREWTAHFVVLCRNLSIYIEEPDLEKLLMAS